MAKVTTKPAMKADKQVWYEQQEAAMALDAAKAAFWSALAGLVCKLTPYLEEAIKKSSLR